MRFTDKTHQEIVQRLDELEADAFHIYRQLEQLRLDLQEQWRVMPNGETWTDPRADSQRKRSQ